MNTEPVEIIVTMKTEPIEIIEQRIAVLKKQKSNETMQQNIQMYEFAIRQLKQMVEIIKINN